MIFCSINLFDMEQPIYKDNKLICRVPLAELADKIIEIDNPDKTIYFEGFEEVIQGLAAMIKEKDENMIIRMVTNV